METNRDLYIDLKEPKKKKRRIDAHATNIVNMINYVAYSSNILFLHLEYAHIQNFH